VWLDPNRANVFYFFESNTLRAGVLDHDFIYTAAELEAELTMPQSLGQSVFAGKWQTSQAIQDWYSDFRDTGVVDPRTLMDANMQAHNYRRRICACGRSAERRSHAQTRLGSRRDQFEQLRSSVSSAVWFTAKAAPRYCGS